MNPQEHIEAIEEAIASARSLGRPSTTASPAALSALLGYVRELEAENAALRKQNECPRCCGTGHVGSEMKCMRCDGSGVLGVRPPLHLACKE